MIKKILLAIAVALPMCSWAQTKIGTVNPDEIVPNMAEYVDAQNQLNESSKTYESEYAKIQDEMKAKYEEFQKISADESTLQSIKDRRMQELQELNQKGEQFAQTAQQELARKQQQLMAPIQEKLMNAIQAVGAEGGFTMILPSTVPFFTAKDVTDVTPLVKAKLGVKDSK
jgi:outer membrane protein